MIKSLSKKLIDCALKRVVFEQILKDEVRRIDFSRGKIYSISNPEGIVAYGEHNETDVSSAFFFFCTWCFVQWMYKAETTTPQAYPCGRGAVGRR
jgi:hypothetical protein